MTINRNTALIVLLALALGLSGCATTEHAGAPSPEADLRREMAATASSSTPSSGPAPLATWGDHPGLKKALLLGTVAAVVGLGSLILLAAARAKMANNI
jgi:hypothetical protein